MRKLAEDWMTARERVVAAIKGEKIDRLPIFDLIHHNELLEYITGKKVTLENGMDFLLRTVGEYLDMTRGIAPPNEEKVWSDEDGFTYKSEWWTVWIMRRPFDNTNDFKKFIEKDIARIKKSYPTEIWTFAGKTDVWGRSNENLKEGFRKLRKLAGDVVLLPPESPVGLDTAYIRGGLELFSLLIYEEPELISEWLEALNEHEVERVHLTADSELWPVALVYADIASKNGLLFSPDFLYKEFFPRLRKLVEAWHSHGTLVIFHSDGNYLSVMDDFVKAGIDGVNPIEPLEGIDHPAIMREKWPQLALVGGIDCSNLLPHGSKEDVEMAVRHAIDVVWRGKRYLLGTSTEIHPACKLENILKMWEVALSYGRYNRS